LAYRLAKIYYHTRDYDRSERMLSLVSSRFPDSPYAAQARDFAALLKARFQVDPHTIGVILPLSGKFKQFGERSLQAIQVAIPSKSGLKLIVKDTQGEPNIAAQALESLVLENHVVAVIGPMFSNEAMAAALKAEELSVPLLALSHREGLPEVGPFVFRTALTVTAQAKALARAAFEELGMSKFALLYPKSRYGLDFITAFWDEVDHRQGEIRGVESYEPDQTTFREPVRRLVGRWYMNGRQDYRDAMNALRMAKLPPLKMRSEVEKLDKTLPPLVDFDAIIIPDSGRQIGLIAPALAFEDVVLTHNPKALEKIKKATNQAEVRPVTLLGASTWNSAQTLDSCEQYCEDAVFVDAYFPNSTDPKVRDFVAAFREVSGAEPYLSEAQAYDTGLLLKTVLFSKKPTTRLGLRDALEAGGPYHGITGKLTFDKEGEAQKDLFVLTIKEHAIQLYERPPEPPRG
ncbi:MAG TPA: penicillin-binding protein activator, partial [Myxococcota bacterium]|nr:penicillin-binding protein activator [Myxococcota bacterium]